uniref:receptor protein-tyrosine kinase n=1 Tax=Trichuris muris TaxID=70415 RepID=A0A5S6QHY5_TRIMR
MLLQECTRLSMPVLLWMCLANSISPARAHTEESHLELKEGDKLTLSCQSNSIVGWRLPNNSKYEGFSDPRTDGRLRIDKLTGTLQILRLVSTDTGYYECSEEGTSVANAFQQSGLALRRWYVHVDGETSGRLFLRWKNVTDKFSHLIAISRSQGGYIDCLITNSQASVSLTFDGKRLKNAYYETGHGFFVKEADLPRIKSTAMKARMGTCEGRLGERTDALYFLLLVVSDSRPLNPWISDLNPPYPYASGPMQISCLNKFDQTFQGSCSWSFPAAKEKNLSLRLSVTQAVIPSFNVTLKFSYMLEKDSGLYVCKCKLAENGKTAEVSKHILVSPRKGYLNILNENTEHITVDANDLLRMVVKFEAWPVEEVTVKWFHHYYKVGEPFQKIPVNASDARIDLRRRTNGSLQEQILEIANVRVTDAGSYIGFVTVASVSTMTEFVVTVLSPSRMVAAGIADRSELTAGVDGRFLQYGNGYAIVCRAHGFPLPIIQLFSRRCLTSDSCEWKANDILGNSLRNSSGQLIKGTFETVYTLPVIAKATGSYMCSADGDNNALIINFIVTDVPQSQRFKGFNIWFRKFARELTKGENSAVFEGDSVALSCMYQKWYYGSVNWMMNNHTRDSGTRPTSPGPKKVGSIDTRLEEGNFSNSVVLRMHRVRPEYAGVYFCSAREIETGLYVVRSYELVVHRPSAPSFHEGNESTVVNVQYSNSFEIACNATAFPEPEFEWLKNWDRLSPSPAIQILDKGRRLKVLRAVKEDAGVYTCKVQNRAGISERNYTVSVEGLELSSTGKNAVWVMQTCLGVLGSFVVALISVVIILKRREQVRVKQLQEMHSKLLRSADGTPDVDPSLPLNEQTENLTYNLQFEIPRQCLKLEECLGVGQFGHVFKGAIVHSHGNKVPPLTVAVKMPRVGKNVDHQSALLSELKIMIYLGFHPNVLSLIGAITKHMVRGELYVLTEFCSLGCLGDYLRKYSAGFVNELVFVTPRGLLASYDNLENDYLIPNMSRSKLPMQKTHYQSEIDPTWATELARNRRTKMFLCTTDLLCYSFQVANGMLFLASKNLIHRDLALRNLLLTEKHLVKIGDFGLTRHDDKYEIKKLETPLPIKWMAIESLSYRQYTVKSDVWSFGIVLWEIFSHGATPYMEQEPGEQFVKWLKSGNRLSNPDHSPEEIYRLMRQCWLSKPEDRPDFADCRQRIAEQLIRCNASAFESLQEDLENAQPQIISEELRDSESFREPYSDFMYSKGSRTPKDEIKTNGLDNATYFNASTLQC